jgi:hypothetical protein
VSAFELTTPLMLVFIGLIRLPFAGADRKG